VCKVFSSHCLHLQKVNYTYNYSQRFDGTEPNSSSVYTFEIDVPMNNPVDIANMPAMPLNPFIFATENRSRNDFFGGPMGRDLEIHLPDQPITDLGSSDYFGLLDDHSNPPTTTFRNAENLPWAIEVGNTEWKAPLESTDISSAYPEFTQFITSGGTISQYWFDNPVHHRTVD
jgi:LruC domain-containing protein